MKVYIELEPMVLLFLQSTEEADELLRSSEFIDFPIIIRVSHFQHSKCHAETSQEDGRSDI